MNEYMDVVLSWLGQYRTPMIILSTALTNSRRKKIIEAYTGVKDYDYTVQKTDGAAYPLITWTDGTTINQTSIYDGDEKRTIYIENEKPENIVNCLKQALNEGGCAGVIVSTVSRAQKLAEEIQMQLPDKEVILFHSEFTDADKYEQEQLVIRKVGKNSTPEERNNVIIVGTQVLEQSLDIDFDVLITDLCPMDLFLQRLGKLQRHKRIRPDILKEAKCIIIDQNGEFDKGTQYVYGNWILAQTRNILSDKIILPDMIPKLIEKAYAKPDDEILKDIEAAKSWNTYCIDWQQAESKAEAFTIRRPKLSFSKFKKGTIRGLLNDGLLENEDEARNQLLPRSDDSAVKVVVMIKHTNGNIGFVPWQNAGQCLDNSKVLSEKENIEIVKQMVRLPISMFGKYNADNTFEELELVKNKYFKKWKDLPLLKYCYFLLLDEKCETELNGFRLTYNHEYGLITEKI